VTLFGILSKSCIIGAVHNHFTDVCALKLQYYSRPLSDRNIYRFILIILCFNCTAGNWSQSSMNHVIAPDQVRLVSQLVVRVTNITIL